MTRKSLLDGVIEYSGITPSSIPCRGMASIRSSTPITNQGVASPLWRQRAIVDFPEEDPPFRTMTWVPTVGRYHYHKPRRCPADTVEVSRFKAIR